MIHVLNVIQGYAMNAQYWHHHGLYPSLSCPGQAVLDELKDIILHGIGDHLISASSTASYGPDELKTMLDIINSGIPDLQNAPGVCRIIFILMNHFVEEKAPQKVSRRFCILSILLFSAQQRHLLAIETMSIDGIVSRQAWNQFSSAVQKTCSDLTVYCTVLIAIDVGILAIQSVDAGPNTSGIKIMLYLSVVACLGSITFAFLLQHKYQGILQVSFSESCQINHGFRDNCDTLENIAVVQDLPFGLLYWGTVFFDTVQYQLGDTGNFVPVLLVLDLKPM
ncbi:hypothetical protein EDD85DRAFT_959194 [Armillaria nabsnona]|nr:hypothetical protein EDD85DRAFT_959194 [Armillaria nabsnona]